MPSWAAAAAHGVSSPSSPSWEEQAFACDAVANLLVWPPRSYSCTFCRREFRSAQALGGHMNVHRRDRARLRHQDDEVQEEPHEGDSFTYKQQVPVSNPSNHDLDEETGRRSKRRRVDQPPSVALPIFARSMAAALVVAPHEGFALDHSKVTYGSNVTGNMKPEKLLRICSIRVEPLRRPDCGLIVTRGTSRGCKVRDIDMSWFWLSLD
ncbi:hypothetical protein ACQ4PT_062343 [Festuca glaucescens]